MNATESGHHTVHGMEQGLSITKCTVQSRECNNNKACSKQGMQQSARYTRVYTRHTKEGNKECCVAHDKECTKECNTLGASQSACGLCIPVYLKPVEQTLYSAAVPINKSITKCLCLSRYATKSGVQKEVQNTGRENGRRYRIQNAIKSEHHKFRGTQSQSLRSRMERDTHTILRLRRKRTIKQIQISESFATGLQFPTPCACACVCVCMCVCV